MTDQNQQDEPQTEEPEISAEEMRRAMIEAAATASGLLFDSFNRDFPDIPEGQTYTAMATVGFFGANKEFEVSIVITSDPDRKHSTFAADNQRAVEEAAGMLAQQLAQNA